MLRVRTPDNVEEKVSEREREVLFQQKYSNVNIYFAKLATNSLHIGAHVQYFINITLVLYSFSLRVFFNF